MRTPFMLFAAAALLFSGAPAASPGEDVTLLMPVQHQGRWDDRSVSINEQEQRIHERIQRGVDDGRITDQEARRLYRELNEIEAKERKFLYEGRLDRRETETLNRDLDRLRDHVRQQGRD